MNSIFENIIEWIVFIVIKVVLEQGSILDSNTVVHATDQEGILLTTDAEGNLAMPVSAEQVIRFLMQTSDVSFLFRDSFC